MVFKWKYQRKIDVLNINIDAIDNIEIKCENEKIPFVKKFTLLGVILDEYLTFDLHTIGVCSKVNWKISVLKKSSYLFDLKFRITLFKLSCPNTITVPLSSYTFQIQVIMSVSIRISPKQSKLI